VGYLHRRLIAFDLDGTLVDSRQDLADSANELIIEQGGLALPTEAIVAMVGEGAGVLVGRALAAAGLPDAPGVLQRFLTIYNSRLLNHTVLYPGTRDLLVAAQSCARVAVLTNKPVAPSEQILVGLGVRDLIEHVIGGDGPHARKPDPAGLLALMQMTGSAASRTMLVGDSPIDRETARRAGVYCCYVTYGFSVGGAKAGEREWVAVDTAGVAGIVDRFAEITWGAWRP
jgi:phosphoglycolate phosphatase